MFKDLTQARALLFLALLLLVPNSVLAQDVTGHWQGQVSTPAGNLPFTLDVSRASAGLVGTIDSPATGDLGTPIVVNLTGSSLHFEMALNEVVLPFDGSLNGAEMNGTVRGPGASYSFTARKVPRLEAKYTEQALTIESAGATLAATLYLPRSARDKVGALVFAAGLAPRGPAVRFLADQFASRGISVLTYDRRGLGKSTGNPRTSFSQLADDLVEAIRTAKSQPRIDATRVGLRGQSQGAWLALLAATREPVAFVVATGGGAVKPYESELYAIPSRMKAAGFPDSEVSEANSYMEQMFEVAWSGRGWDELSAHIERLRVAGAKWLGEYGYVPRSFEALETTWRNDFSYDPAPALRSLRAPLLALEGEQDVYSPPQATIDVLKKELVSNSDFTVRIIPEASHDFRVMKGGIPLVSQEYLATLVPWVLKHANDTAGSGASEQRGAAPSGNVISLDEAKARIILSEQFRAVGTLDLQIGSTATAKRYIFVAMPNGAKQPKATFIIQLERRLESDFGHYSLRPDATATLGGKEFQKVVGFYSFAASSAANPGAEAEKTMRFFREKQIDVSADLLVARFARIPDEQKRSELVLFYFEPVNNFGSTREELQSKADKKRDSFRRFEEQALRSFDVIWTNPH